MSDTIFALATPPGRSGVAVVRVSGPQAELSANALGARNLPVRSARTRRLVDSTTGLLLDEAVVLRFLAPNSFTGEDVVEFQVHGSPAVIKSLMAALSEIPGLRVAEPGEFTRRALMNGKLDLAQVEGIADLLSAETEVQQRQALSLLSGEISLEVSAWRSGLVRALAMMEASIDFSDDGVTDDALAGLDLALLGLADKLDRQAEGGAVAERIRLGFQVALVGAPNVGKSTLLNAIAKRDVAITSEHAGTTRDVLEVRLDLHGLPVTILDTAGLRSTNDPVEAIGVARSRDRAEKADVRIFLLAAPEDRLPDMTVSRDDIVVLSKGDLQSHPLLASVSGQTGTGVSELLDRVAAILEQRVSMTGSFGHARQQDCLRTAVSAIRATLRCLKVEPPAVDLAAMELGVALRALDSLVGKVDTEQVLDVVFASFCLGK